MRGDGDGSGVGMEGKGEEEEMDAVDRQDSSDGGSSVMGVDEEDDGMVCAAAARLLLAKNSGSERFSIGSMDWKWNQLLRCGMTTVSSGAATEAEKDAPYEDGEAKAPGDEDEAPEDREEGEDGECGEDGADCMRRPAAPSPFALPLVRLLAAC
jgi:hypothetical protein